MLSHLCDRCMTCSHEILFKFDFKTEFNSLKEVNEYIKLLLESLKKFGTSEPNIIDETHKLNYPFLDSKCENCLNLGDRTSRESILIYLKILIVVKIFECVTGNNFKGALLSGQHLIDIIRNKIITFHLSKEGNEDLIYYYNQEFINYRDLNQIPNFEEMSYLPKYYLKIFKVPIYLANINQKDYLSRKILNLDERLKKHNLSQNKNKNM